MGYGLYIRCHHCGHHFERLFSCGRIGGGTAYCNTCGREKQYKGWEEQKYVLGSTCECGGRFDDEARGTCPNCGVVLKEENVDYDAVELCLWD